MPGFSSLGEALSAAVNFLKSAEDLVIVSHYDADGLTSGAIASLALDRLGKEHTLFPVKKLDDRTLSKLEKEGGSYWFVDLGSGQLDKIDELLGPNYLVCDHHETVSAVEPSGVHLNAHELGMDGSKEISGAGMTYLVAKELSNENRDLSAIAIVGAVGDMQDSTGALVGKNRDILADAVSVGVIRAYTDLRFFGRYTRPLPQFLSYASDIFFPGLTGNDAACSEFLRSIGLPLKRDGKWLTYMDLKADEKRKLVTGLYVYALSNGISEGVLKTIVGEVYDLVHEGHTYYTRDAKDFATLLNACGRHGEMLTGIMVAKGDRGEYYRRAVHVLQEHRRAIREAIKWAVDHGLEDMDGMYLLDARGQIEDSIIGIVAGMLYNSAGLPRDKPIIALANDEDGNVKVSARGNWNLVKKGLHLGKAMKDLAETLGEAGGGHNIAAGATVKQSNEDAFLHELSKKIREQLSK